MVNILFTTNYRFYFLFLKWICILYWSTHLDVDVSCAGLPVLQYSMAQVEEEIPAQIKYFGVLRTLNHAVLACQYSSSSWPM